MLTILIFYFSTIVTKEIFYSAWDPESVIYKFNQLFNINWFLLSFLNNSFGINSTILFSYRKTFQP